MSTNQFEGALADFIPSTMGSLTKLEKLHLNGQASMRGTIPAGLSSLHFSLKELQLQKKASWRMGRFALLPPWTESFVARPLAQS